MKFWIRLFVGLVFLALIAWLAIPVPALKAPRPEWKVVGEADNAWPEYHELALEARKAETFPDDVLPAPGKNAQVDSVRPAFGRLIKAAARSGSQRFEEPPSVNSTDLMYVYKDEKTLVRLALAESRRLAGEGQLKPALELALACYEMGADLSEPGADLTPTLVGAQIRRRASLVLFELLQEPALTEAQARAVLAVVESCNQRIPLPGQAVAWDREAVARGLEETLEQDAPPLPGLKARLQNSVQHRMAAQQKLLVEAMETWDPVKVQQAQEEAEKLRTGGLLMRNAVPEMKISLRNSLRQIYLDRVNGSALECLAAVAVYACQHKRLPARLEEALAAPPTDPRTGKPPGYKVEGAQVLLWYPGPDGADDQGQKAVNFDQPDQDAGADVIYRFKPR